MNSIVPGQCSHAIHEQNVLAETYI